MYEHITFESILQRMLSKISNTMDKREGSIIYDALAPAAVELQLMYIELDNTIKESFGDTATRPFLIKRASERGLHPYPATYAVLKAEITPTGLDVPIGSRFNCNEFNYSVIKKITDGEYHIRCETIGREGNSVFGDLIPIEHLKGLETARLTELLIPAEDEEDTEKFRERYFNSFNPLAFGGNIADYVEKVYTISGVGGVKVTPIWNGGGTVKLTIIDSEFSLPTDELISKVQTEIDPEQNQGEGLGLAPIGHIVTVVGAEQVEINIESEITFKEGYTLESALETLQNTVDAYFLTLRKTWEKSETLIVRVSQLEYNFLDCEVVIDVANTKINGESRNFVLQKNQIPTRGQINGQ